MEAVAKLNDDRVRVLGTAVARIAEALEQALAAADRTEGDLIAIGVGVPGRVEPAAGTVTRA